ncbi:Zn-ribbon domain-containing OB-fold protein [Nocardioides marmoriginsengisoli]|uniref:Zn-ribbon domain-containing OB-fold protein n=1 Tax=Nocardioides marmoriginsengisoli TaxID=661483 RepID=A0A3N0CH82_9ACTN|nr:Zn-ribbon domain-containing OB-fold protein [Nocardioides marmoriginsengisoli]RNL62807.1 Zn-ribbon domain-containing OB-fold protein [Nocardioides marmoriginsengisoli]
MPTEQLAYPPRMTEFTAPFWDGLREGRLSTTQCTSCAEISFPPKPLCPGCWSSDVTWIDLRGTGTLRSYTEVSAAPSMFAHEVPYTLCLVDLDEGVRCLSRVRNAWDELVPDARVEVVFREAEPAYLFEFVLFADPSTSTSEEQELP